LRAKCEEFKKWLKKTQGLSNLEDLLLERHLGSCVLNQVKSGQADKAKKEILKVYKLKRV